MSEKKSSPNHVSQHDYINLGTLSHIESQFIPHTPARARLLLERLKDGKVHSTKKLIISLGTDPRAALQDLTGDRYGHWRILNRASPSKMGQYQIDPRHLSRLEGDDSRARNEAQLTYRRHSRQVAENGLVRHQKAIELEKQAQAKVDADKQTLAWLSTESRY